MSVAVGCEREDYTGLFIGFLYGTLLLFLALRFLFFYRLFALFLEFRREGF